MDVVNILQSTITSNYTYGNNKNLFFILFFSVFLLCVTWCVIKSDKNISWERIETQVLGFVCFKSEVK